MEDTQTTLYRDIIIETIGFEAYQDGGPNGTIVLDEGAADFIKQLVNAPIKKINQKIKERHNRIEKIEVEYKSSLQKMGINTGELDDALKHIVKKNVRMMSDGVKKGDRNLINKAFTGIRKGIFSNPVVNGISAKMKDFDPDTYVPAIGIYSMVVVAKLVITVLVSTYLLNLYEWNKGDRLSQWIWKISRLFSVVVIGPLIDQAGIILSIKANRSGEYQLIANTANSVGAVSAINQQTSTSSFNLIFNRVANIGAHLAAGKISKNAGDVEIKNRHFFAFLVLAGQRLIEVLTMGGRYWQYLD